MIASVDNSGRDEAVRNGVAEPGLGRFRAGNWRHHVASNGIRRAGFATQLGEDGVAFLAACLLAGPIAVMPREMSTQSRL